MLVFESGWPGPHFLYRGVAMVWQILGAWLWADFVVGVFHFVEDKYMVGSLEIAQSKRLSNVTHHTCPTALCMVTAWQNCRSAVYGAVPVAAIAWALGAPVWLWLGFLLTGAGPLVHRWAHMPDKKLSWPIKLAQRIGFFQSKGQHLLHHYSDDGPRVDPKGLATRCYCVMSNYLNPVLDLGFWDLVIWTLRQVGVKTVAEKTSTK